MPVGSELAVFGQALQQVDLEHVVVLAQIFEGTYATNVMGTENSR